MDVLETISEVDENDELNISWTNALRNLTKFDNGIFNCPPYYLSSNRPEQLIAVIGGSKIYQEDFSRLLKSKITNFMVDHLLLSIKVNALEVDQTTYFLSQKALTTRTSEFYKKICQKTLYLPLLKDGHFTLLIVDFSRQTLYHLNPLHSDESRSKAEAVAFKIALESRFRSLYGQEAIFRIGFLNHPIQQDAVSCGVFVIFYAEQHSRAGYISQTLDNISYRNCLMETILKTSDPITYCRCLKKKERENASSCICCGSICHVDCLNCFDTCNLCAAFVA